MRQFNSKAQSSSEESVHLLGHSPDGLSTVWIQRPHSGEILHVPLSEDLLPDNPTTEVTHYADDLKTLSTYTSTHFLNNASPKTRAWPHKLSIAVLCNRWHVQVYGWTCASAGISHRKKIKKYASHQRRPKSKVVLHMLSLHVSENGHSNEQLGDGDGGGRDMNGGCCCCCGGRGP